MITKDDLEQLDNLIAARNKTLITLIIEGINSVKVELKGEINTAKAELRVEMKDVEERIRKDMATKEDIRRLEAKIDRTTELQNEMNRLKRRLDELESRFERMKLKN